MSNSSSSLLKSSSALRLGACCSPSSNGRGWQARSFRSRATVGNICLWSRDSVTELDAVSTNSFQIINLQATSHDPTIGSGRSCVPIPLMGRQTGRAILSDCSTCTRHILCGLDRHSQLYFSYQIGKEELALHKCNGAMPPREGHTDILEAG